MKSENIFRKTFRDVNSNTFQFKLRGAEQIRLIVNGEDKYEKELFVVKVNSIDRLAICTPEGLYWLDYDGEDFIEYYKPDGSDFQKLKLID
jgi:hypothetical protein